MRLTYVSYGSWKGCTTGVYCTQPYPAFLQEGVSTARTRDFLVTWNQLYQLRLGFTSEVFQTFIGWTFVHMDLIYFVCEDQLGDFLPTGMWDHVH